MSAAPECLRVAGRRVIVEYVNPPIPMRQFDYCAVFRDYEPGDPQGYGSTPKEAVFDLAEKVGFEDDNHA